MNRTLARFLQVLVLLVGFVAIAEAIIFMQESDDRAGGVAMGLMIGLGSVAVAFIASKFERSLGRRLAPPSLG
jgi:hypothetical protein